MSKLSMFNSHVENNTCVYRVGGHCIKCGEYCPTIVKYNDNNENNIPCDMVSYSPDKSKSEEELK